MNYRKCYTCKEEKPLTEFSLNASQRDGYATECKVCKNNAKRTYREKLKSKGIVENWYLNKDQNAIRERKRQAKILFIEYKGGKCFCCGLEPSDIYPPACFDFHHINPEEKDKKLMLALRDKTTLTKEVKAELDKTVLVCSNCHRAIMFYDDDIYKYYKEVKKSPLVL